MEAGAAKDELKRLRKEMLRLKNEWTTLRALYESAKVCYLRVKQTSAFAASEADQILMRPYCACCPAHHLILARSSHDCKASQCCSTVSQLIARAMTIWSPNGRYSRLRRIIQPSKANTVTYCADDNCISRTNLLKIYSFLALRAHEALTVHAYQHPIWDISSRGVRCQVREQQAQEANEAQVADLRESLRAAAEEASDLRATLATVVPRDQLTAAELRIKVTLLLVIASIAIRAKPACIDNAKHVFCRL